MSKEAVPAFELQLQEFGLKTISYDGNAKIDQAPVKLERLNRGSVLLWICVDLLLEKNNRHSPKLPEYFGHGPWTEDSQPGDRLNVSGSPR